MLPAVQRSEDTGGRQQGGCKDTQLLLGDFLHSLLQKVSEGQRDGRPHLQVAGIPMTHEAWWLLEGGGPQNGTVQSDFKHFQACFAVYHVVTLWCQKITVMGRGRQDCTGSQNSEPGHWFSVKSHKSTINLVAVGGGELLASCVEDGASMAGCHGNNPSRSEEHLP